MKEPNREYPLLSACGLNCGLCPRFHTEGASRCPGCGGEAFYSQRPTCGVLSCNERHGGLQFCSQCPEYPCQKLNWADQTDSFISHRNMHQNLRQVRDEGLPAYQATMARRMKLLQTLLTEYNDGRRKSFYCTAVNLLPLAEAEGAVAQLDATLPPDMPIKEKAKATVAALQLLADGQGISLALRKPEPKAKKGKA